MAQVFAHHLAVTLCLSVCAPSHLAPGAFLGPTGRGVRWFLGSFLLGKKPFLMESIPSFVVLRFVWNFSTPHSPGCAVNSLWSHFWAPIRLMRLSGVGTARLWGVKTANLCFVCIIFGAGAFFSVFGLLVALNIMSGDLKLQYVENVSLLSFYDKLPHWRSTANVIFFFNWLLAQLDK